MVYWFRFLVLSTVFVSLTSHCYAGGGERRGHEADGDTPPAKRRCAGTPDSRDTEPPVVSEGKKQTPSFVEILRQMNEEQQQKRAQQQQLLQSQPAQSLPPSSLLNQRTEGVERGDPADDAEGEAPSAKRRCTEPSAAPAPSAQEVHTGSPVDPMLSPEEISRKKAEALLRVQTNFKQNIEDNIKTPQELRTWMRTKSPGVAHLICQGIRSFGDTITEENPEEVAEIKALAGNGIPHGTVPSRQNREWFVKQVPGFVEEYDYLDEARRELWKQKVIAHFKVYPECSLYLFRLFINSLINRPEAFATVIEQGINRAQNTPASSHQVRSPSVGSASPRPSGTGAPMRFSRLPQMGPSVGSASPRPSGMDAPMRFSRLPQMGPSVGSASPRPSGTGAPMRQAHPQSGLDRAQADAQIVKKIHASSNDLREAQRWISSQSPQVLYLLCQEVEGWRQNEFLKKHTAVLVDKLKDFPSFVEEYSSLSSEAARQQWKRKVVAYFKENDAATKMVLYKYGRASQGQHLPQNPAPPSGFVTVEETTQTSNAATALNTSSGGAPAPAGTAAPLGHSEEEIDLAAFLSQLGGEDDDDDA